MVIVKRGSNTVVVAVGCLLPLRFNEKFHASASVNRTFIAERPEGVVVAMALPEDFNDKLILFSITYNPLYINLVMRTCSGVTFNELGEFTAKNLDENEAVGDAGKILDPHNFKALAGTVRMQAPVKGNVCSRVMSSVDPHSRIRGVQCKFSYAKSDQPRVPTLPSHTYTYKSPV
ncbi:hypothetical protein KQX54_019190 [Cotesia glomerata]|uniref:Uncharacterized protein n=1 Tax=Cotesia glomerata TaxID=32391 RepID=A0AAV7IIY0_COTGL|nr:hypothetical protein KQX54_019190 [Cotesia glomerata]